MYTPNPIDEWSDFVGMSNERTKELYNNMLDYIVESVGKSNAIDVLRAIGFTDEEIIVRGLRIGKEELI